MTPSPDFRKGTLVPNSCSYAPEPGGSGARQRAAWLYEGLDHLRPLRKQAKLAMLAEARRQRVRINAKTKSTTEVFPRRHAQIAGEVAAGGKARDIAAEADKRRGRHRQSARSVSLDENWSSRCMRLIVMPIPR